MSSTVSTYNIPFEIDEIIIDLLAENDENYLSIKACSLVCRTFLPLCRKHIFGSIVLNSSSSPTSATTHQLERLLSKSPEIADYIRKLDYTIEAYDFTSPSTQVCLKRISSLQSLSLQHYGRYLNWSNNDLRPVLLYLLHLPTLTDFQFIGINHFVASDLIPCVNLKKLHMGGNAIVLLTDTSPTTLPNCSIQLNELVSGFRNAESIMNMLIAQRPDGQPVINFSCLAKITLKIERDGDTEASQELFRRCKQLTDVSISFHDPRRACPSLSKMLRLSMQTLKHPTITAHVEGLDLDPLIDIPSELEDMRNKNIIETIDIKVIIQVDDDCRRGDDWGRLDEVLTRSGWSALRQVSLTLNTVSFLVNDGELEVALRNLPETQFRRLSTSKSISFKFDVIDLLV